MVKPAWAQAGRTGPVHRYMDLVVFACEGLICVIDERPQFAGKASIVTPSDMETRIKEINRGLGRRGNNKASLSKGGQQDWDKIKSGCEELKLAIQEARDMGDPSDPAVQDWWRRHRRISSVTGVSAGTDAAGYPPLPPLPLGKFTGRTTEQGTAAKTAIANAKAAGGQELYRPPQRKLKSGIILDV